MSVANLEFGIIDGGEARLKVSVLPFAQVVDVVEGHGEARRHARRHVLLLLARQPGGVLQGLYLLQTPAHLLVITENGPSEVKNTGKPRFAKFENNDSRDAGESSLPHESTPRYGDL